MTGPPAQALEQVPDRAALQEFVEGHEPPFRVAFRRGVELAEAEFADIRADYGNGRAELVYPDGRHVTVDVGTEVDRLEVSA